MDHIISEKMNQVDIAHYVEKIRIMLNMSIKELTKDIVSTRNYSRILSHENSMTFEVLIKLLEKMNVPLFDFSLFMSNSELTKNAKEITFLDLVKSEQYKEAYDFYITNFKDQSFQSFLSEKTLPIAVIKVKYKLNLMNHADACYRSSNLLNMKQMIQSKTIEADEIEALNLFVDFCNDSDKKIIATHLLKFTHGSLKLLSTTIEHSTTIMYLTLLKGLTTKQVVNESDHKLINYVKNRAVEYQNRAKMAFYDVRLFEILYLYAKKIDHKDPIYPFAYYLSVASSLENTVEIDKLYDLPVDVYEIVSVQLNHRLDTHLSLYEEIIHHDF